VKRPVGRGYPAKTNVGRDAVIALCSEGSDELGVAQPRGVNVIAHSGTGAVATVKWGAVVAGVVHCCFGGCKSLQSCGSFSFREVSTHSRLLFFPSPGFRDCFAFNAIML